MQTRAVLFDLDGTLVDSLPTLTCSLNAYLAALGKAPFTEKEVSDMVGKGVRVLLQKAFACRQVPGHRLTRLLKTTLRSA